MSQAAASQSDTIQLSKLHKPFPREEKRNWIIAAALILLISVVWLVNQSLTKQGIFAIPSSGPAAPWQAQLALAQSEAIKRDKDAVLANVYAYELEDQQILDPNNALRVAFQYYTPSGTIFDVAIRDVNPPQVEAVGSNLTNRMYWQSSPPYPWDVSEWYKRYALEATEALKSVEMSPRQFLLLNLSTSSGSPSPSLSASVRLQLQLPYRLERSRNLGGTVELPTILLPQWEFTKASIFQF